VGEEIGLTDEANEPPEYIQMYFPELEKLFEEATVEGRTKKANLQSAAGLFELHYGHLQVALCDDLTEEIE